MEQKQPEKKETKEPDVKEFINKEDINFFHYEDEYPDLSKPENLKLWLEDDRIRPLTNEEWMQDSYNHIPKERHKKRFKKCVERYEKKCYKNGLDYIQDCRYEAIQDCIMDKLKYFDDDYYNC